MSIPTVGTEIDTVSIDIDPGRMKVFSLLTDDPNPIHWDRQSVADLGLGDRLINQGGLNVGYIVNAVAGWAGSADRIRTVSVRFRANAFEGETVLAGGTVTEVRDDRAVLDVWLRRFDGETLLSGSIEVDVSTS